MKKEGTVANIYMQSDNWVCFRFEEKTGKNKITARGKYSGPLMPGMKIVIEGNYVEDKKYGRQIEISNIYINSSITATFLHKCVKGVGMKLAEEIVRVYGEDCIDKIIKDDTLLLKVKGIKEKKYKMITESLKKADSINLYLSIFDFFNNDVSQNQADKIVDACKKNKVKFEQIKKNPYWLITHVDGFGFKKVDKLALASGMKEFSVERIGAAIIYSLQQMSQIGGHCFSDMEMLSKDVAELVLGKPEGLSVRSANSYRAMIEAEDEEAIKEFINKNDNPESLKKWRDDYCRLIDVMCDALVADQKEGLVKIEDDNIYWIDLYEAEVSAAKIISEMAYEIPVKHISEKKIMDAIKYIEEEEDCELSDEQVLAVKSSLQNKLSVITGGPGRGKTTIIKAIIDAWDDDENVVLLAPTGRAAKRMSEASGHPASTIHRYKGKLEGDYRKRVSESSNPDKVEKYPKNKLFIVDETSMLGIKLGNTVLRMARNCNLIFVGDIDQLASIEPGSFMKDIINSEKVMVSRLTKGFRNSGSIAINADKINHGKHLKNWVIDDHTLFNEQDGENIVTEVVNEYKRLLTIYKAKDIGILSPMRSRGYGSVDSVNDAIRSAINPETKSNPKNGSGYLVNDRVMHIKNNYKKEITNEYGIEEEGIFNGDTGTITKINYAEEEVSVLLDDGRHGIFSYEEMKECFIPAYAITIHKSQGSEYKAVIIIVTSQHAFFLKRNMVYTGITRAKELLEVIGDEKAVAIAARNIDDSVRNTTLKKRIVKFVSKS